MFSVFAFLYCRFGSDEVNDNLKQPQKYFWMKLNKQGLPSKCFGKFKYLSEGWRLKYPLAAFDGQLKNIGSFHFFGPI